MQGIPVDPKLEALRTVVRVAALLAALGLSTPALSAETSEGEALLERNCGRCHAVAAGDTSPLAAAPNLFTVLSSYPDERLDAELAEGIGSHHREMPQIQFTDEEITAIYYYLRGGIPEPKPQQ
jgi:mono/diheme cytochrome c family protein